MLVSRLRREPGASEAKGGGRRRRWRGRGNLKPVVQINERTFRRSLPVAVVDAEARGGEGGSGPAAVHCRLFSSPFQSSSGRGSDRAGSASLGQGGRHGCLWKASLNRAQGHRWGRCRPLYVAWRGTLPARDATGRHPCRATSHEDYCLRRRLLGLCVRGASSRVPRRFSPSDTSESLLTATKILTREPRSQPIPVREQGPEGPPG